MNYEGLGYIAKVMDCVVTDGPGMRVSVYVSGCSFQCPNCFNASIWAYNHGERVTDEQIEAIIDRIDREYISGLSILGGEPLENLAVVRPLIQTFRERFGSDKSIWLWSGYMLEYIERTPELRGILGEIDVLVDGPFVHHLYQPNLKFRGSLNQRIHDFNKIFHEN